MKPKDIIFSGPVGKAAPLTKAQAKEYRLLGSGSLEATLVLDLLLLLGSFSLEGLLLTYTKELPQDYQDLLALKEPDSFLLIEEKATAKHLGLIGFSSFLGKGSITYALLEEITKQQQRQIEAIAMGLGLELFKDQLPRQQALETEKALSLLSIAEQKQALKAAQQQISLLEEALRAQQREANILSHRLEYRIKEARQALALQRRQAKKEAQEAPLPEEPREDCNIYAKALQQRLGKGKLCLVGGLLPLQRKLQQLFPSLMLIDTKNFDPAKVRDAQLVIINTQEIGHAITRKAVALALNQNIQVHYTSKSNVEALAQALLLQLDG